MYLKNQNLFDVIIAHISEEEILYVINNLSNKSVGPASIPLRLLKIVSDLVLIPCKNVRCQVCDLIVDAKDFTSTKTGEKFSIEKGGLDCNSDHIVYLITCKVCQIQNVGSTKSDKARKRFNNYKSGQRKVRENILGEVTKKGKRGRPADENKIHHTYYYPLPISFSSLLDASTYHFNIPILSPNTTDYYRLLRTTASYYYLLLSYSLYYS